MYISIDFNSDEALYLQLRNQIVYAIVKAELREGNTLVKYHKNRTQIL